VPELTVPLEIGASRFDQYMPLLTGKKVGLVVNQTSMVGNGHLVDVLLKNEIAVKKVFAPEHGFRGEADAGEQVSNAQDVKTGLPIISLYGKNKKPTPENLEGLEVVVFDIQDVGARFYTYISTMHYVMEACAENNIPVIVLDRPNPNGHYVDGPVREEGYESFVGMHPIPIVHGLTVGELAKMINGEKWLKNGIQCPLTVVPCLGYSHAFYYELPVKPSPNLPNIRSIYWYPSLCLFEATSVSVGRGTDKQFQIIGSPAHTMYKTTFTPISKPGAKYPKHENIACYGYDLSAYSIESLQQQQQLDLSYLLQFYADMPDKTNFFTNAKFFDKLAGTSHLQAQIKAGKTESQIRASWQPALNIFKEQRKSYLLYTDFD